MSNVENSVKARLQADLTTAMKARAELATSTLRMVRAAIMNAEVAGDEALRRQLWRSIVAAATEKVV